MIGRLVLLEPAFLLLAAVVAAILWLRLRAPPPSIPFGPAGLLPAAHEPLRSRFAALPVIMDAAAGILLVCALARPAERVPQTRESEGIDVLLCLDTSSSMKATDLDGKRARLDVAKEAAARFLASRTADRVGLVTFARFPDLRCPPTLDHAALSKILAAVSTVRAEGPEDATGIGGAIAKCAQVLRPASSRSRVVVLLTDGAENVASSAAPREIAPLHAAQLCAEAGIRVYAITAGSDAATDTRQIDSVASRTGGRSFRAADATALRAVYGEIDALEKQAAREPRFVYEERFLPFVLLALAAVLGSFLLRETWLEVLP